MKKIFALFLSLALLVSAVPALAQEATPGDEDFLVESGAPPIKLELPEEVRSGFPTPTDQVTVQDGIFIIVSKGVTLTVTPPFGMMVLAQDITAQVDEYLKLSDPRGTAESLIAGDLSLYFYDYATQAEILGFTRETTVSKMFKDSDETFDSLLTTAQKSSKEGTEFSEVVLNNKRYIRQYTPMEGGVRLVVYAIKDSILVAFQLDVLAVTPELEQVLHQVVESTTF